MSSNPYAPPTANLETAGLTPATAGRGDFDLGQCISEAWANTWSNFGTWLGTFFVWGLAVLVAALTGIGLVAALGPTLLQQPWLIVALTIYALNLGLAFFIQRPNLRRLIGVKAAPEDQTWRERAKRQRYVSYLMAGLVGVIGFLMSTKPNL